MGLFFYIQEAQARSMTEKLLRFGLFYLTQIRMKDKILSAIKVAIGKTNINDRTLTAYVGIIDDKITDESQIDEAIKPYVEVLKEFQGNMNSEIAAQVAAAKSAQPPVTTSTEPPSVPPVATQNDAILAKLNEISERQNKIEQAEALKAKQAQRSQFIESIRTTATAKGGWATNAGLLTNALALITIEDADTEESISKKCQDKYNAMATDIFGKSDAVPGVSSGGSGEISAEERAKAIAENQKQYRSQQV